jgi:DNA mismatch endonuclease (patch repair protein)
VPTVPRYDRFKPASKRASKTAQAIRRADTKGELALRRALRSLGLCSYRTHVARLAGRPDLVFVAKRVVVFCDGDFWHGRNWRARKAKLSAGSNAEYWVAKIQSNLRRDRRHVKALKRDGWIVLRFWESDVLADPAAVARRIGQVLAASPTSVARRSGTASVRASRSANRREHAGTTDR